MRISSALRTFTLAAAAVGLLSACGQDEQNQAQTKAQANESNKTLRVGTMAGPEEEVMEVAKQVAKDQYGLDVEIVAFNDYISPNAALDEGSLDANAYQHKPYLDEMMKSRDYNFAIAGHTFVFPMSAYSLQYNSIDELPEGAKIAIPNDPSNEGRALIMLNDAGLITLKDRTDLSSTLNDITENPQDISFAELDAAQLPRSLQDVDLAVINSNFATGGQLPEGTQRLLTEGADSPYVNLIVVREGDTQRQDIQTFVKAFHTQAVIDAAKTHFDNVVPGWTTE